MYRTLLKKVPQSRALSQSPPNKTKMRFFRLCLLSVVLSVMKKMSSLKATSENIRPCSRIWDLSDSWCVHANSRN